MRDRERGMEDDPALRARARKEDTRPNQSTSKSDKKIQRSDRKIKMNPWKTIANALPTFACLSPMYHEKSAYNYWQNVHGFVLCSTPNKNVFFLTQKLQFF
jgi:hypothetical protein